MNWRRIFATVQIYVTLYCASLGSAACWAFIISGLCRIGFGLGENESLIFIGIPIFVFLFVLFVKKLPEPLRRAGMLSEEPEKYGPWFKKD